MTTEFSRSYWRADLIPSSAALHYMFFQSAEFKSSCCCYSIYLVYMLEVLDNLYEQFGVLFMYLVSHSCFVLLLGQATLQKVSPILLRRSIEWKCQERCSIFNLHLWTADYGLYKPSFSLWFEIWGRKFWNLKRTHHEALQLWMKLLHLQT